MKIFYEFYEKYVIKLLSDYIFIYTKIILKSNS